MTGPSDPVSTFLSIVVPWASNTYVNIEALEYIPAKGKLMPKASRAARDLQEASSFARWADSMGWEVYVRMASFRQPGKAKVAKNGRTNYRTISIRDNAVLLKSFYVDVDVKPGAYNTLEEARQGLLAVCEILGLPRPSIVVYSGGGGFHAHLVLPTPIPVADWLVQAHKLQAACQQHGLKADHNVTVNPVCLLRIPGTHNRKYGAPRPVMLEPSLAPAVDFERIKVALIPYHAAPSEILSRTLPGPNSNTPLDPKTFPGGGETRYEASWLGGISDPPTLDEIAAKGGCPLVEETLKTGGKDQSQPLWFRLGGLCTFTEGGPKDFHLLSKGHPTYDPADTDLMYERVLKEKAERDLGWPRCATMEQFGSIQCKTCSHRGKGKSPLNFAVRAHTNPPHSAVTPLGNPQCLVNGGGNPQAGPTPVALLTVPLDGYSDDQNGHYTYEKTDAKGNTTHVRVWNYPMWNIDLKEDEAGAFTIHFDTRIAKQRVSHVTLPTTELRNGDTMKARLTGHYALGILSSEQKGLLDFMATFKSQMRDRLNNINRQELMGWTEEGGKLTGFIYGPTKYNCAGNTPFNQPNIRIRENYFPVGSIDPWLEAIAMINAEKRPAMDILVATAFAAPLMRFTSEKGVVISAFSSSTSVHKSTALRIGQAVWGSFEGISQFKDTMNAVVELTGTTRVMPKYFDEMRSSAKDIKQFVDMVFTIASGRGRARLNRNAELKAVNTWETLLVGASNTSLFDHVAHADKNTDAGVARIFEFEVPQHHGAGQISLANAGKILKALENNYGRAGEVYAQHLGKSVDTLPDKVTDMLNKLEKELKMENGERYWISAAAAILVGAQEANDIGLAKFDVDRMYDFIKLTFAAMRMARSAGGLDLSRKDSIREALAIYVNTNRRSTIASNEAGQAGRAGTLNLVEILNQADIAGYNEGFTIRYIRDPSPTMRINKPALTKWLLERGYAPGVFYKNLKDHYQVQETVAGITTGTSFKAGRDKVIVLDLTVAGLTDLYEI